MVLFALVQSPPSTLPSVLPPCIPPPCPRSQYVHSFGNNCLQRTDYSGCPLLHEPAMWWDWLQCCRSPRYHLCVSCRHTCMSSRSTYYLQGSEWCYCVEQNFDWLWSGILPRITPTERNPRPTPKFHWIAGSNHSIALLYNNLKFVSKWLSCRESFTLFICMCMYSINFLYFHPSIDWSHLSCQSSPYTHWLHYCSTRHFQL